MSEFSGEGPFSSDDRNPNESVALKHDLGRSALRWDSAAGTSIYIPRKIVAPSTSGSDARKPAPPPPQKFFLFFHHSPPPPPPTQNPPPPPPRRRPPRPPQERKNFSPREKDSPGEKKFFPHVEAV